MATASDLAEWWEGNRKYLSDYTDQGLSKFVDEHPGWFAIAVATVAQTAVEFPMAIGAGFVDLLNLGKGAADGGWGWAQDGLRLVSLVGPLARGSQAVISRVLAMSSLDNCTWIAATKALHITGTKPFAVVGDLARAAGIPTSATAGAYIDELLGVLQQLGARVRLLPDPGVIDDVVNAARANPRGVVAFSVEWNNAAFGTENVGHTLLAVWRNGISFVDRSGKVVGDLKALQRLYPGIGGATTYGTMAVVENALIPQATLLASGVAGSLLKALALEVKFVFSPPAEVVEEARKQAAAKVGGTKYVVRKGDWLSKIALRRYNDALLWPLIFDANAATVKNPNLIQPGQELTIPDLKAFTPAQIQEARERGRNWRAYNNN